MVPLGLRGSLKRLSRLNDERWWLSTMDADSSFLVPNAPPLISRFDLSRVRDDLMHLCADAFAGRRVGTLGHDRAKLWLAERFASLGLESSTFEFTLDTPVLDLYSTPTLILDAADDDGEERRLEHRRDFSEHPRSADHPKALAGVAVPLEKDGSKEGTWTLLDTVPRGEALGALAHELARQGVIGLLTPQYPGSDGYLTKRIVALPAISLPVLAVRADLLSTLAGRSVRATVPIRPAMVTGGHILGRLAGADAALNDAPLLIGAHYDGVGDDPERRLPGAADNASAVAVVLELARILAGTGQRPGRPIIFATFDAEEVNALGSRAYARVLAEQRFSPLVLNLDGAARFNDAVWVEAGPESDVLVTSLDQAGRQLAIPLVMGPVASDNRRFAGQGFPAVGIGLGGAAMHSPADVPERVEAEAQRLAGALLLAVAWHLAYETSGIATVVPH